MSFALLTALVALAAPAADTLVRERPRPFADQGACSVDHFCWENPLPAGVALNAVWVAAPGDVWAAGEGGALLHLEQGRWRLGRSPTTERLTALWGSAVDDVWAVGPMVAMHFDGRSWTVIPRTEGSELAGVWGASRELVFLAGTKLQRFDGHGWKVLFEEAGVRLLAVGGSGPKDVWAVGEETPEGGLPAHLVAVHFDGATARKTALPHASPTATLVVGAPGEAWIGGEGGLLLRLSGNAWKRVPAGSESEPVLVGGVRKALFSFTGAKGVAALGSGAPKPLGSPAGVELRAVAAGADGELWGVGRVALLHHEGKAFQDAFSGVTGELRAIHGSSAGDVYAVGDRGLLLHRDEAGWQPIAAFTDATLRGVYAAAKDDVYVVGDAGAFHSDGGPFTALKLPAEVALGAVAGSGPRDVWITGAGGATFHFDGRSWGTRPTRTTLTLTSLAVVSPKEAWASGDGREVIRWDGFGWTTLQLPAVVNGIAAGEKGAAFAAGEQSIWQWSGQKWLLAVKDAGLPLAGIFRGGSGDLEAFGAGTGLHEFNGVGWRRKELPQAGALRAGFGIGGATWLVGGGGTILRRLQ